MIITLFGITLRFFHLAPWPELILVGGFILIFGFLGSYLLERISLSIKKASRIGNIISALAAALILYGVIGKLLHYPGSVVSFLAGGLLFLVFYIFYGHQSDLRKLELRSDRQLASILFTDIVGYTALMGENESLALKILERNRKIQVPLIKQYQGRLLKELGDGTLSIFFTASDAVMCAVEIMKKIRLDGFYKLRMGIHIGEIVFSDKDIFGDGVNISSRIMNTAKENEICLSEAVYLNIKNKDIFKTEVLGDFELKNVSGKMRLFKIDNAILATDTN